MTPQDAAAPATGELNFRAIGKALEPVQDPEIHISVVELGLVYGAKIEPVEGEAGNRVTLTVSLTSPACPYGPMLLAMIHGAVAKLPSVRTVDVDLTFNPLWDPRTFASEEAKDKLGIF